MAVPNALGVPNELVPELAGRLEEYWCVAVVVAVGAKQLVLRNRRGHLPWWLFTSLRVVLWKERGSRVQLDRVGLEGPVVLVPAMLCRISVSAVMLRSL